MNTARREHLQGRTLGSWYIVCSLPHGYWLARCVHCHEQREARFDKGQTYLPRCHHCGHSDSGLHPKEARARYLRPVPRQRSSRGE